MTKIDETGFMAALMVVNAEWTYFPTTATDREVTLRKAIEAYEAAKTPLPSSLGKRIMYEDGTPSREYEEQPDNSIAARIEWSKEHSKTEQPDELSVIEKMVKGYIDKIKSVPAPHRSPNPRHEASEYAEVPAWALKRMAAYLRSTRKRESGCTVKSDNWQPIETKPDNTHILVHYKNGCGKSRVVKARYITKFTEENDSGEDWCDYNELTDTYYDREGWYEDIDNWPDYSHVAFCEGTPDAWMPLPKPPLTKTTSIEDGEPK